VRLSHAFPKLVIETHLGGANVIDTLISRWSTDRSRNWKKKQRAHPREKGNRGMIPLPDCLVRGGMFRPSRQPAPYADGTSPKRGSQARQLVIIRRYRAPYMQSRCQISGCGGLDPDPCLGPAGDWVSEPATAEDAITLKRGRRRNWMKVSVCVCSGVDSSNRLPIY
jgi:hypothetical protein